MGPVFHRLLFWSARVLSIALIGLLSLFALDVFQEYHGFGKVLVALAIHLIPTFLLLAISLVAWRREWLGALLFAAAGAGYAISVLPKHPSWAAIVSLPLLLIAALYFASWMEHAGPRPVH